MQTFTWIHTFPCDWANHMSIILFQPGDFSPEKDMLDADRRQLLNLTLKINMTEWLTTFPGWHGSTWRSSRDSWRTLPQKRTSMMLCLPFCCCRMQVKLHLLLLFWFFFCETIIQTICITAPRILYMYYWKKAIRQNIRLFIKSHAEIWRFNWFKNTSWIITACNSYDDVML